MPTAKAISFARWKGVPTENAKTPRDLSLLIDAKTNPDKLVHEQLEAINKARTIDGLEEVRQNLKLVHGLLRQDYWAKIIDAGINRRKSIDAIGDDTIPD